MLRQSYEHGVAVLHHNTKYPQEEKRPLNIAISLWHRRSNELNRQI